jgi:hypothetical protein
MPLALRLAATVFFCLMLTYASPKVGVFACLFALCLLEADRQAGKALLRSQEEQRREHLRFLGGAEREIQRRSEWAEERASLLRSLHMRSEVRRN